ncbi:MAG: hypothetical protein Q7K29_07245 [Thermoleophilia bacterium]|nr:hypothetical protein [Thermoleophilia bacterium]
MKKPLVKSVVAVMVVTGLMLIAASITLAVPSIISLTSPTHPDDSTWYPDNNPTFSWAPSSTSFTRASSLSTGSARGVAASGNYVFAASFSVGLEKINVLNPAAPMIEDTYDTPGSAIDVVLSNDLALVADGASGLNIININNPSSFPFIGSCDTPGTANGIAISGNYAYIADGASGLQIIDVNNPASAALVGYLDTPGYAYSVTVAGNNAFVADGDSGLKIIDVSNPASASLVGYYDTSDTVVDVAVAGNHAFIADGHNGVRILDISNTSAPAPVGSHLAPWFNSGAGLSNYANVNAVSESGGYVFMVYGARTYCSGCIPGASTPEEHGGIEKLDVSDPANPIVLGSYSSTPGDTHFYGSGVALGGDFAYISDDYFGPLQIINVNPAVNYSYSYLLNQSPATPPDNVPEGTSTSVSYTGLAEGEYYFHVATVEGSTVGPASHRRVRIGTNCGVKPGLGISMTSARWASFADYQARLLTVAFSASNPAGPDAQNLTIVGEQTTNGVTAATALPLSLGNIVSTGSAAFSLQYSVPAGVSYFRTTVYSTAEDACGATFEYPGPFPGA